MVSGRLQASRSQREAQAPKLLPCYFLITQRIEHLYSNKHIQLYYGDMTGGATLMSILAATRPDVTIYNLAVQSHVKMPAYTARTRKSNTLLSPQLLAGITRTAAAAQFCSLE